MTTPSPLVVENLSFRYRDRQGAAIHDISFETNLGEILLIAGAKMILIRFATAIHSAYPAKKSKI